MKQVNPKALKYIAKTYGKNVQKYAGDEDSPSDSEVQDEGDEDETIDQGDQNLVADVGASNAAPGKNQYTGPVPYPTMPVDQSQSSQAMPPGYGANAANAPSAPSALQAATAQAAQPLTPQSASPFPANNLQNPMNAANPYAAAGVPDVERGMEQQQAANTLKAKALAKEGASQVTGYQDFLSDWKKLPSQNDIMNRYAAQDDQFKKEVMNNKIDPNHYFENASTGQKVLAGIGVFLGGVGGGMTGQGNAALGIINGAINRDMEAQKTNQSNVMNLWKMNQAELGNALAADLQTRNQMLTGVQAKIHMAAANAMGPLAKSEAMNANGAIQQQIDMNRFKLSLMTPTSDSFGIDPAKKIPWLVPAQFQGKVSDEVGAAQNATKSYPAIMQAFDQAANEVRPGGALKEMNITGLIPGMESPGQKMMKALMAPTFIDIDKSVRAAGMDKVYGGTVPEPWDYPSTLAQKRQTLENYLMNKKAAPTASSFGINLSEYPSTNVGVALPPPPQSTAPSKAPEVFRNKKDGSLWTKDQNGVPHPYQGKK